MSRNSKLLLIILFVVQLFVASSFELAHDEAYYWLFSKHLDWGYFDHPPMVALVIRFFSFLGTQELTVRLGFIVLQFASVLILLSMIPRSLHFRAVLLFFSFPLASLTGLFALPDIPLLFWTAVYCWVLNKYLKEDRLWWTVSLGFTIAFLLNAKYHGLLLVFFTLVALPRLMLQKRFYYVAGLALFLFLPHLIWQYQHEFSTLRYHFMERPKSDLSFVRQLEYLITQIFLAGFLVGPVVWKIIFKTPAENDFERVLKTISFGTILFFFFSTLSKKFEANWTIYLAIPLVYLSARSLIWERRWAQNLLIVSFLIVGLARGAFLLPPEVIRLQRAHEFNGWKKWAEELRIKCEEGSLMANSYKIAAKLSFYLQEEVHALNYHSRKNQFDYWRFDLKKPTEKICYITDKPVAEGGPIESPEGKKLLFITRLSLAELLHLKEQSLSQKP
jgi:4-amino-4-deoxy-L-arabinose transferase-like glycosyltransferase